jgi:hypothetical protein
MKPGWAGKGKGLLQVLWEHGWIDESKIARYKKIVTDDAGFIVKEFSLARMLETCTDFANEKTQLEFLCQSLGTGSDNNSGLTKGGAMVGVGCLALRLGKPVGSDNCA